MAAKLYRHRDGRVRRVETPADEVKAKFEGFRLEKKSASSRGGASSAPAGDSDKK